MISLYNLLYSVKKDNFFEIRLRSDSMLIGTVTRWCENDDIADLVFAIMDNTDKIIKTHFYVNVILQAAKYVNSDFSIYDILIDKLGNVHFQLFDNISSRDVEVVRRFLRFTSDELSYEYDADFRKENLV